jgi:hypothetical protein
MTRRELEARILALLKNSSVMEAEKEDIDILLPIMSLLELKRICKTLENEARELRKIARQKERMELQYKVMVERLVKTQNKVKK